MTDVRDGTKAIRCDRCQKWSAYSGARVMGWCQREKQKPIGIRNIDILLAPQVGDQTTAYNQRCDRFSGIAS